MKERREELSPRPPQRSPAWMDGGNRGREKEREIYDLVRKEEVQPPHPNSFGFRALVNHRLMSGRETQRSGGKKREREKSENKEAERNERAEKEKLPFN